MKKYIASYQDGKGDCWDLEFSAENYKEALKDARAQQCLMGKLYSCRMSRQNNS